MSRSSPGPAVVSGGGSGIGRAIALELASRGYPLALLGRRPGPLQETLAAAGGGGLVLPCDVRSWEEVSRAADEVHRRWPAAEIVVPAAGIALVAPLEETAAERFGDLLATNLAGTFHLIRAFLPGLIRRGKGWIFPLISAAGRRGFPGWSAYCASKWGVAGLVASLRDELANSGVRLTALYPGATDTPLWDELGGGWDRSRMMAPAEVARAVGWALEVPATSALEEIHLGPAGGPL